MTSSKSKKRTRKQTRIITGEYYHIINRGNHRDDTFLDKRDFVRFLFYLLYFQSPMTFRNASRQVSYFCKYGRFNVPEDEVKEIIKNRFVELVAFCIMPNHYHLIVRELKEGGLAEYMMRISNAQTKYYNTKYKTVGHLFQGTYKAVHIKSEGQLAYTSCYAHMNAKEIQEWRGKENQYPWSSFQDYTTKNRFSDLLVSKPILGENRIDPDYREIAIESGAKFLSKTKWMKLYKESDVDLNDFK